MRPNIAANDNGFNRNIFGLLLYLRIMALDLYLVLTCMATDTIAAIAIAMLWQAQVKAMQS